MVNTHQQYCHGPIGKFMKIIQWIGPWIAMAHGIPVRPDLSFALGPRWIDPLFDDVAQEVPSDQSGHEKLHLHVGVKPGDSGRSHDGWKSLKNGIFRGDDDNRIELSDCEFFWILIIYKLSIYYIILYYIILYYFILYYIILCYVYYITILLWILVKHWSDLVESSRTFPSAAKPGDEQWSNGSLMEV